MFRITTTSLSLVKPIVLSKTSILPKRLLSSISNARNVVVVDGVRIPFATQSSIYNDELAVDLQRMAIKGLVTKSAIDTNDIDYVFCGKVIQDIKTSNIAREAALGAGLPHTVCAHTVTMACISSNAAICAGAEKILTNNADVVIAGGVDTFSAVPINLSRPTRQKLIQLPKAMKKGGTLGAVKHMLKDIKKDFKLEFPAISNYTTGEVMGVSSDRLSAKFGVNRTDQDSFAVRSHTLASKAHDDGFYNDEIVPYNGSIVENGIKKDASIESVSKLKPAFIKPHGTHTAANSSFLSDGASATLLMSEEKALSLGLKPMAYLRNWSFQACDPFEELLLGPTYCTSDVLKRAKLGLDDIGVFEIHEAFAGQILSNLVAMGSQKFANEKLNGHKIGDINMDKLNTKGGSLGIGHPFGATGSRLVTTACRRLQLEQERFALIAACADGGLGHACILERYDNN